MKLTQDFSGIASRVQSIQSQWQQKFGELEESWKDKRSEQFYSESIGGINELLKRWITSSQEAAELLNKFSRALEDTDRL